MNSYVKMIIILLVLLILFQYDVLCYMPYNRGTKRYSIKINSQISTSDIITTINDIKIIAKEADIDINTNNGINNDNVIALVDVSSGWGNGAHPTTRLSLECLSKIIKKDDILIDYGM